MKFHPKKASDYTPEEKIKIFDDFHQYAVDVIDYMKCHGQPMEHSEQYAYEMIIDLLGEGVWKHVINRNI